MTEKEKDVSELVSKLTQFKIGKVTPKEGTEKREDRTIAPSNVSRKLYECENECGFESPLRHVVEKHEMHSCGKRKSLCGDAMKTPESKVKLESPQEMMVPASFANAATEESNHVIHGDSNVTVRKDESKEINEWDPRLTLIVYPKECLGHDTGDAHQEHSRRLRILCDKSSGVLRSDEYKSALQWMENSGPVLLSDILRVHDHAYVEHLTNSCRKAKCRVAGNPETLTKFDPDTVLSPGSLEAAMMAAGAVVTAVDAVAMGACRNVFCAVRPPGHHSGPRGAVAAPNFHQKPDMCSCGFCLFNNVAIGAAYARNRYGRESRFERNRRIPVLRRIAIVDFDVHHGNGTEQIIREMRPHEYALPLPPSWPPMKRKSCKPWLNEQDAEEVWFGSVHLVREGFYPCSGPDSLDSPSSDACSGDDNIVNVALPTVGPECIRQRSRLTPSKRVKFQHEASRIFRDRISTRMLPKLQKFNPDIIFISAGFDAHHTDFYHFLTTDDYRWITEKLCEVAKECCDGRVVSVLEGGYQTEASLVPKIRRCRGRKERTPPKEAPKPPIAPLAECVAAHVSAMAKVLK
eukprot:g2748.t1